jgi:nucleoside-diphosphate kinase
MVSLTDAILDEWYVHHKDKPFFGSLKAYMKSYPVIAMLWEGIEAAETIRIMLGVTRGRAAIPGTIRGDYAMSQQYNLVHASESSSMAEREQKLIFHNTEIFPWKKIDLSQIYADEESL